VRCLLAAVVLLAACGDNLKPNLDLAEYLDARHSAECERLVRCGLFDAQATCEGYSRPESRAQLEGALGSGAVRYDGSAAFVCVEVLATISCDATTREARVAPVACQAVLRGTIADGEICAFDDECMSAACDAPVCPKYACCPGTCEPTRTVTELGGACGGSVTCSDDAFCSGDGTCTSLNGAAQPCNHEAECEYGLACVGATEFQSGSCRALPLLGGQCLYRRCAQIGATCSTSFVCVPSGLPGSACSRAEDCSPYSICDITSSSCENTPTLGMPCATRCAGNAWCDGTACSAPMDLNEPCGADDQCATTFCTEGPVSDYCAPVAVCF